MRESLREFIYREAGPDAENRLSLIRHLSPSILVAGGYDFNELRQLIQYGPGWNDSFGSEYVSATWPEVPVVDPLPCITIRPFTPHGYTTAPYELVALLAWHLRDVLVGAEPAPDFDGIIKFGYIEPESADLWTQAAERWRALQAQSSSTTSASETEETPAERRARFLGMFEDEVKIKERGALQRLADRVDIDRANLSKILGKARTERDAAKPGGWMTSQLIVDGKRKG